jgi:hypothetical protein
MLKSFRKSTRRPYHRVRLLLERLEDRIAPSVTYDWVGGNQGDPNKWEEPKNWKNGTPNQFPGSNLGTPDDHAEFLGANSTFTCNLFSSRQIGALTSDDAFNATVWINGSTTLSVLQTDTVTDWHGGDIGLGNTGSQLDLRAGSATFSGSTQNSSGRLNPSGNGGALGTVRIYNGESVTFASNFSLFGANITLGLVVGQTPTKGSLLFGTTLAGNVTDDRNANITVNYGTLTLQAAARVTAASCTRSPAAEA